MFLARMHTSGFDTPPPLLLLLLLSLQGAAQASLAAFMLSLDGFSNLQLFTFGNPQIGDAAWRAAFDAALGSNHVAWWNMEVRKLLHSSRVNAAAFICCCQSQLPVCCQMSKTLPSSLSAYGAYINFICTAAAASPCESWIVPPAYTNCCTSYSCSWCAVCTEPVHLGKAVGY
jgi:hypothetical protein